MVGLLLYEAVVAVRLRIDYFDAYENLLNASRIVHAGTFYSIARALFYPLMLTPIALLARLARSPGLEFIGAHLLAVILFGLLLLATFKIFRLFLTRLTSLVGVTLMSGNLLLLNNAPQAEADIPGALFTTAAFYFYLRGRLRQRPRDFVLAGPLIGAAIGTRYNLLLVPFILIGVYEIGALVVQIANGRWDRSQIRPLLLKVGALLVLPVFVYFLLPVIVYPVVHQATVTRAPVQFVKDVIFLAKQNTFKEDPIRNYRFLLESVTWPLLVVGAVGAIASVRNRLRGSLFFALWLTVIFLFQTYLVGHREARYLFPMFPAVYFFVAVGLETLWTQVPRLVPVGWKPRVATAVLLAGIMVLPALSAVGALARFQDPVYTRDYEGTVSRHAAGLVRGGQIYWVGPYFSMHPRDYIFDRDDPFTYVYHFYTHVVTFWTGVPVFPVADVQAGASAADGATTLVGPGAASRFRDGDVVIVNPAAIVYVTRDIPSTLPPLIVEQIRMQTFTSASNLADGSEVLVSPAGGQIRANPNPSTGSLDGTGLADGTYELYAAIGSAPLDSLGSIMVSNGAFHARIGPEPIQEIVLVSYASVKAFPFSTS
jgi:hypothetical protein